MANQDVNSTVKYWIDGTSGITIKAKSLTPVSMQPYWYNGACEGFLAGSSSTQNSRNYCILIGF